ncbi:DNA topoisomerase III [Carnobacterium divergens]|uniref:DNA topoisomerase 3 n=1 Tax=Carnobacterium divergens TaxID=2748 RepID=UPI00107171FD|nr:DNA topoisomerase 3 [Carnobacterium divergens]TFJ43321.1 DNA topoisomerase III [Carnobacterium divergens]TFJ50474.1 DNA topoisomerase III [Carnobacterium divergens]
MKTLIIAEKPSVGKEIARVLGATQKNKNFIEGKDVIVTWALGHLLGLKMPEDYKKEWANWDLESLPLIPPKMAIKPLKNTGHQLKAIKQLANRKDIDSAVIATDAGREGELVARWILEYVHFNKPVKRLWISSQTDKAIKEGFKNLKPSKQYDALYDSAIARSQADWLVGLNVTRALTVRYQDSLSAGRVQTPTLAMVRKQEEKIETFMPETFYTVSLMVDGQKATLIEGAKTKFKDRKEAEELAAKLKSKPVKVNEIKEKIQTDYAPIPYDLTELQRDANKRYQFSAKKTLGLMQTLYERHKVLSYPRTDSKHLTTDMAATMKDRLHAVQGFSPDVVKKALRNGGQVTQKGVFNNSKVTDHHGIIPTEERPRVEKMESDELKIYRMVVERFLGLFLPAYQAKKTTYQFLVEGIQFQCQQEEVIESGWKQVEAPKVNASYKKGEALKNPQFAINKHLTEAPSRLTEATLLQKMEKTGLGTPATRAEIIEKLISSELMERAQNKLSVSPKGRQLLTLVNPTLVTPDLTAKWEKALEEIAASKLKKEVFIKQIEAETTRLVKEIKTSNQVYTDHSLTNKTCPDCGEKLKEKNARDGKILVCSNTECSYRRRKDPKVSMHRCSQCHKKMEIHEGKNGAYFKCKFCNISEKIGDKKNKKMSKHEEKKMLKKYSQSEEEVESPLALALKAAMKENK